MNELPTELLNELRAACDAPPSANNPGGGDLERLAGVALIFLRLTLDKELSERAAKK